MTVTEGEKIGSIALYIYGDQMDPADVTSLLGVKPSTTWKMGDMRQLSGGSYARSRTGLWTLSRAITDNNSSNAVSELLVFLGENLDKIKSLSTIDSVCMDVYLSQPTGNFQSGTSFRLSAAEMKAMSNAGLDFEITISSDA